MSLSDIWYALLAAVLAFVAYRGVRAGRFSFTHEASLATDREETPFWFWAQFALILATIAVLLWAVVL